MLDVYRNMRLILLLIVTASFFITPAWGAEREVKRVAMILFRGETPAEKGFRDILAASEDFKIDIAVFDANQSKDKLKTIIDGLDQSQYDLFYVFGTMAAQVALEKIKEKPVIFNVVQRPVEAKLVKGWESSGNNSTGVSNIVSMESAFKTLSLVMNIRKLAFIYYEKDPAPKFQKAEVESVRKKFGFKVIDVPVHDLEAIPAALKKIVSARVDAVMFPSDSFIKANAGKIMAVINQYRIPSVVIIPEMVKENGALIALGPDYQKLGEMAGISALEILKGKKPSDIPIKKVQNLNISVNLKTADKLGINLPIQLLSLSTVITEGLPVLSKNNVPLVSPLEIYMMLRAFIPVVIIAVIGIIIGRWDSNRHQITLQKLMHYIFLPCLTFSALHKHAFVPTEIFSIALAVITIISVMTLVSVVVLGEKFKGGSRNVLAAVYMSSGTMLPPLAFFLFGNQGLAKAIYFHFFVILAYHTAGLWMVDGKADLKGFVKTPFIYMIVVGIAAQLFPFSLPDMVEEFCWLSEKGIDLAAMGGLPLMLISFGYPLGLLKLSDAAKGLRGGLLRIVAGPAVALLVVYCYRKTGILSMERGYDVLGYLDQRTTEALLILGAAMSTSNLAMRLKGNEVQGGKAETGTLLVSTAGSIIVIPAVLLIILIFIFAD